MVQIGDYVKILNTNDNDLCNWLEEQEEKGIDKHKVIDIDAENGIFWIENCDYSVWFNEDVYVKEELK